MVKILLFLIILIVIYAMYKVVQKIQIKEKFLNNSIYFKHIARQMIEKKISKRKFLNVSESTSEITEYDQQLFDDASLLFSQSGRRVFDKELANQLQHDVLKKMPLKTETNVRLLDLDEWSIYWGFYQQSLEYYVSRYGIFITHVDRYGNEHKVDYKK